MQNTVRLAILLIVTLLIFPILAFQYDQSMTASQWELIWESGSIMLVFAGLAFVVAEITGNYSQTDKLWGLAPIVYLWHLCWTSGFDPRLMLMAVLVTLWGLRLSYNFSRRGGYSWKFWEGEEDYRWTVLKEMPVFKGKPFRWSLFNLFFIALYQHSLIWLMCSPAIVAASGAGTELGMLDFLTTAGIILLLIFETISDQQQFDFQQEKYRLIGTGGLLTGDYKNGFLSSGLWGMVRHPNYACEQGVWLVFYFFSIAATDRWINWSLVGALLLLLLFKGSSDYSERISSGKYPKYADYQKRVGRFIPKFHGRNRTHEKEAASG